MKIGDVDALFDLLARGIEYDDGEPVDLLAHALQCADRLSAAHPDDGELQIAGLVHDVASVAHPDRPETHAAEGARMVGALLGRRVAWLVSGHVAAKRWLVTHDPAYRSRLSPRSVETLQRQGGALAERELARLAEAQDLPALLDLRRADDDAKVPGAVVPASIPGGRSSRSWLPLAETRPALSLGRGGAPSAADARGDVRARWSRGGRPLRWRATPAGPGPPPARRRGRAGGARGPRR